MDFIEDAVLRHDLNAINDYLRNFQPDTSPVIISTSLLRSTSRAKHLLPEWQGCLDTIKLYFDSESLNTNRLLRGLIN